MYHERGKDPLFKIWHASEQAMFIYMHSDGGSIVCNENTYPIKKGALCFVGAGKYHYTMPDNPQAYNRSKIFVAAESLSEILKFLPANPISHESSSKAFIYAMVDESERDRVEAIFEKISRYENDGEYAEWMLTSCIIELLVFLNKYTVEKTFQAVGVMSLAMEYINENIQRDISIDEICAAVHMSKYHFCRQFKKITGTTVMNYIKKTRVIMAKNMLINESLSVAEISNRCGFSSISYFSRIFKEETGVSPLKYKKNKS